MKEITGDLIKLTKEGNFDVIVHGCNCFCTMESGIAKQIRKEFPEVWMEDQKTIKGDINKLGNYTRFMYDINDKFITIINAYTQYKYGKNLKPLDIDALVLVLRKINHGYKGKSIGLPLIGAGLAGGDWNIIKEIINKELKDMNITIVHYNK